MFSKKFTREDESLNLKNSFALLPKDIRALIYSLLSAEELLIFGRAGTFFYRDVVHTSDLINKLWIKAFTNLNYAEELIKNLMALNAIKDYFNLYRVLSNLPKGIRLRISHVWQWLCISGEPNAIDIGIQKKIITENERNPNEDNILYYAVLSGVPAQLDKIIELNDELVKQQTAKSVIRLDTTSVDYLNIFHFAILSGKREQIQKVLKIEEKFFLELDRMVKKKNKHPLHLAVVSNSPEQVDELMEMFDVNLHEIKDVYDKTPLDYAGKEMHQAMQDILVTKKHRPI